ncbi:helix-turn-helix domain-containing protein [Streptomyces populi]
MAQEPATTGPQAPVGQAPAPPPGPVELSDLAVLKALAHPRRQRMLQHLALHGPATSATLGRALGLNTGSTSYHLRELARHGFVEETSKTPGAKEAGGAAGRERWWRAVPGDRRFPPRSRQSPGTRLVMDELNHHAYAADLRLFERIQRETADDDPWADAFPYSRGSMRLTLPELRAFFEEYIALLNRYKRPETDTPPGAHTVLTRFLAFPAPAVDPRDRLGVHDDRDGHDDCGDRDDRDPGPAPTANRPTTHPPTTNPPTTKRTDPS